MKKIGEHKFNALTIDIVDRKPCYRLSQYGKGLPISCKCDNCLKRGQTPAEAKTHLDNFYKKMK